MPFKYVDSDSPNGRSNSPGKIDLNTIINDSSLTQTQSIHGLDKTTNQCVDEEESIDIFRKAKASEQSICDDMKLVSID